MTFHKSVTRIGVKSQTNCARDQPASDTAPSAVMFPCFGGSNNKMASCDLQCDVTNTGSGDGLMITADAVHPQTQKIRHPTKYIYMYTVIKYISTKLRFCFL